MYGFQKIYNDVEVSYNIRNSIVQIGKKICQLSETEYIGKSVFTREIGLDIHLHVRVTSSRGRLAC